MCHFFYKSALLPRLLASLAVLVFIFISQVSYVHAKFLTNLEQQINITNEEFTSTASSDSPTDNGLGLIHFDGSDYNGETVYFEVVARCDSCSGGNQAVSVSLYNDAGVQQTTLSTTNSSYTRLRSGSLVLPADDYTVRFFRDATGGTAYLKVSRIIIDQYSVNGITQTQTQVEMGHYENVANTGATILSAPKHYTFDADQFDGTVNAYFEATFRTSNNDVTSSYFFDGYDSGGEEWSTNASNMVDENFSSFASTATDSDVQLLNTNGATTTDLGQINTVEVRAFGYQTDGADGQVQLRPVFGGSSDGTNHAFTPPENSENVAWSSYIDITTDTNAPSSWTWTDVDNLDLDIEFTQGASGTNTAYIGAVQVRVSYEDNTAVAYVQLYNVTNDVAVATVSSSDNDYSRVRSSALAGNWDTTNDDVYQVRYYTSDVSYSTYIANAKIVIDQLNGSGINSVETVRPMIVTDRSQTNTTYTQDTYITYFDPANYSDTNDFDVYFEALLKTSASSGYIALYNSSEVVDNPTTSELSTTSTEYDFKRSADISNNTDWISGATELTPVLKASSAETVTVSQAQLIVQSRAVEPEMSFSIGGVNSGITNNGVTTSITTTSSTIPFGNLAISTPVYAAQSLNVIVNEAVSGYVVYMALYNELQGTYPANYIDPFVGSGALWTAPQSWTSPTGTSANDNTGWIGANTSDTDVSGWSGGSGKFGPIDGTKVMVMRNASTPDGADDTEYVSFGIEVNQWQPADMYAGTIVYEVLPTY